MSQGNPTEDERFFKRLQTIFGWLTLFAGAAVIYTAVQIWRHWR